MKLAEIFVAVRPNTEKTGSELKGKLSKIDTAAEGRKVAGRFGLGFNGAFGGIVKHSAGLFVGAFAVIKSAQVFGKFISDARESAQVGRITAAAIKSTGNAAKVTADQVGNLATKISNKTGADDEAIQSGENLLLTFTKVRNEVGKGNDIFNRASQAAVDMAAAMNNGEVNASTLKTANIQLGKALNDPIKGIAALGKAGVSFSADQKKQIKTMVEAGDTLGAQKVILKEVGKEFGGAAEAAGDPLRKLQTILGNVSESIGGVVLPVVDKFATFLGKTVVPGIYALGSAFQGEGVTSNGFVGFMEKIGVKARDVFGFFKAEVLPRLKDFAGFITGTVIPKVAELATNLATTFKPAIKDVFDFVKAEVLPRLKDFAGFIGDKIVPKLASMADSLSKNKDFLIPFVATIGALVAGLKIWAIIQAVLNAELFANPIGLVVLAIAALVAGVIWAFKNVGWFHDAIVGAFNGIKKAAQLFAPLVKAAIDVVIAVFKLWWEYYAKPILKAFWEALKFAWEKAQDFARVVGAAFNAIKEPARVAIKYVIDTFLGMVETVLIGASKAFGWVPNLGDKLKNAAKAFGTFRDEVNKKLSGIRDQEIKISPIVLKAQAQHRNSVQDRLGLADGGEVPSWMGVRGKDSVPAVLMPDEHVLTTDDVAAMGGQKAVYSFRQRLHKFAKGGAVGVNVDTVLPNLGRSMADIANLAKAVAHPIAQALGNQFARINPAIDGVLSFVKSQAGKPYVWGGVGPNGYDCSGLVSAAINVALGRNPYHRLGATGSMPWSMFAPGPGAFEVGWFQGNPGHTAATVNGVNIESAGGVGVRYGKSARGSRNALFDQYAHVKGLAAGGRAGDAPFDLINPRGQKFLGRSMLERLGIKVYDQGGPWPSGTLGANLSGQTEHVTRGGDSSTVDLGNESIRSLAKAFASAIAGGEFRLVQRGGAYILQNSNG